MTEAFWWYVLAGFLLGFSVSTLWEWLYFRRRRMAIRDRRIAELEATVRTYAAAATSISVDSAIRNDWAEPTLQSSGVYLETEEAASVARPDTLPPLTGAHAVRATNYVAPAHNGVHSAAHQSVTTSPASTASVASFQSLAVQPPPAAPPPTTAATFFVDEGSALPGVLAAMGAAAVVTHLADDADDVDDVVSPAPTLSPVNAEKATTAPVYANGHVNPLPAGESRPDQAAAGRSVDAATTVITDATPGNRDIARSENEVLVTSSHPLIDNVNHAPGGGAVAEPAVRLDPSGAAEAETELYTTHIASRTEYVLVQLVQSVVAFVRQLRTILTGAETPRPALHAAPASIVADDLTQIDGLYADHAARLRTAGVTTFAHLAQLSPDEVRLITLTPGAVAADYARWPVQAAQFAASAGASHV